ncbi:MAG TPA: hypothetical protein VHT51_06845 [Micropepsaceae bacterium]|jgi:hypothetical protein|nr:hypothetical protein [Micropepsaceae bacterium]
MSLQETTPIAMPIRRLAAFALAAAAVATVIMFCLFLPAEYGYDVTGFGKLTGLTNIAAAQPITVAAVAPTGGGSAARPAAASFRADTIDIPLPPDGELEYKVQMKAGDSIVYSWTVEGFENPEWFYYDFHGETWPRPEGEKAKIAEYAQKTGVKDAGSLVAPFEGVHGWYLQNQGGKPVTVHLKVSGFYQLVQPGEYGNLDGIIAASANTKASP